jgi:hypothetical protein
MTNPEKPTVKQRVVSGVKEYALIVSYLWIVLLLLELYKFAIYRELNQAYRIDYKIGFALINALVLGKVILLGEDFHVAERLKGKRLFYSILFKSAVYAVLLVCFNVLEEVIVGMWHGKTLAQSIPQVGGGGLEGELIVGTILFVVLIPFFAYTELRRGLGKDHLHSLMFTKRPDAA